MAGVDEFEPAARISKKRKKIYTSNEGNEVRVYALGLTAEVIHSGTYIGISARKLHRTLKSPEETRKVMRSHPLARIQPSILPISRAMSQKTKLKTSSPSVVSSPKR